MHAGMKGTLDKEPKFSILYNYLIPIASRWRSLGVNLGLENEISLIDGNKPVEDQLFEVLTKWRRKNTADDPYTWRTLIGALEQPSLQEHALARQIKDAVGK